VYLLKLGTLVARIELKRIYEVIIKVSFSCNALTAVRPSPLPDHKHLRAGSDKCVIIYFPADKLPCFHACKVTSYLSPFSPVERMVVKLLNKDNIHAEGGTDRNLNIICPEENDYPSVPAILHKRIENLSR
jgi:hypothetical protein